MPRMRTQMLRDMPSGEVDWEPVVLDPERLREEEERVGARLRPPGRRRPAYLRRRAGRLLQGVPAPRSRLRRPGRHDGDGCPPWSRVSGWCSRARCSGSWPPTTPSVGSCTPGTPSSNAPMQRINRVLGLPAGRADAGDAAQGRRCLSGTTRCRSATGRSRRAGRPTSSATSSRAWCEAQVRPADGHGAAQAARLGDGVAGDARPTGRGSPSRTARSSRSRCR